MLGGNNQNIYNYFDDKVKGSNREGYRLSNQKLQYQAQAACYNH